MSIIKEPFTKVITSVQEATALPVLPVTSYGGIVYKPNIKGLFSIETYEDYVNAFGLIGSAPHITEVQLAYLAGKIPLIVQTPQSYYHSYIISVTPSGVSLTGCIKKFSTYLTSFVSFTPYTTSGFIQVGNNFYIYGTYTTPPPVGVTVTNFASISDMCNKLRSDANIHLEYISGTNTLKVYTLEEEVLNGKDTNPTETYPTTDNSEDLDGYLFIMAQDRWASDSAAFDFTDDTLTIVKDGVTTIIPISFVETSPNFVLDIESNLFTVIAYTDNVPTSSAGLADATINFLTFDDYFSILASDFIIALNKLVAQETYHFYGITTFGYVNATYETVLKNWAANSEFPKFFVIDTANIRDFDLFKASLLATNNFKILRSTGWDKVSGIVENRTVNIAPSSFYLELLGTNINLNREFVPIFWFPYGIIPYVSLQQPFTLDQREELLDLRVNSVKYDARRLNYYLQNNLTSQSLNPNETPLGEEHISRAVLKINDDLDYILESLISKYNTKSTRDTAVNLCLQYYKENFEVTLGSPFKSFTPVCDEKLNPIEVRQNHQLVIEVYSSFESTIKEVLIYHKVLQLEPAQ